MMCKRMLSVIHQLLSYKLKKINLGLHHCLMFILRKNQLDSNNILLNLSTYHRTWR
ncbi:unnamed protein product [Enterobius vermicularis]|uniref:Uncharacterized protein n=1 Tax=Enterobius vermicularis TaxID=51028 RepID=A0A0N4VH41_ENTVE|nr:unnamed protein product [Enterobius vermicularis]